jgi:Bacterial capsule synthesis protein PGA_cap
MNTSHLKIWQSPEPEPVAARIAIAGDFLPAGRLEFPPNGSWCGMANRLAGHFEDVDTSFVNLEACVDADGLEPRTPIGLGQIVSAPLASLNYLQGIRAGTVSIANNHSYDYGDQGVARTKTALVRNEMVSLGAGVVLAALPDHFIWQGPGSVRVGFWAAAKAASDLATLHHRGLEPANLARGKQALGAMKSGGVIFCVALLHAGCMRASRPEPEDLRLMESLAASGFDVVAASHSHRIAGFKQVTGSKNENAFCFFGLGSVVSGYVNGPLEREGLIVVAGLGAEGKLISLEVRPVLLDATGFGACPLSDDCAMILHRFRALSAELSDGSYERHFYREVSQGLGRLYLRDAHAAFVSAGIRGLARKAVRLRMRHMKRLLHRVAG